jgi:uncharacterized protein YhjY with autotransporter beta-barrel domain
MTIQKYILGSVAPAALLILSSSGAWADLLADDVLIGTTGDGIIFSDPEEGVLEPGIKAVTFTKTRIPDGSGGFIYVDPYEEIITDFTGLGSRGDVTNCLMASNPDVFCDSESGSGKRIKTQLTGRNPFSMHLRVAPSATYSSVDYFTFGKVSNFTGARITSFSLELLDVDGNAMGLLSPADAVLYNLGATAIGLGARLPDGLFGAGGQEGDVGFFSDTRAGLALTSSADVLDFGALSNAAYVANFGTVMLDNSMVPDGIFWDDNNDPNDESALVAWNNLVGGGWTYGTLDLAANIDARLAELASSLGVTVADLGFVDGGLVPADIIAAAEANGLFEVDPIEDLRNANLNYTMTVGTVDGGQVTVRFVPVFAPIVSSAQDEFQFAVAGHLDAAANVPYWDLGNAAAYQVAIADMMAMSDADRSQALTSVGFSFAPAFSSLGFESARGQVSTILNSPVSWGSIAEGEGIVTRQGNVDSWRMGDDLYAHISVGGSSSTYDATTGSVGYSIDETSFSVGIEKRLSGTKTSIGLALGSAYGSADANQGLGNIDSDGFSLTAFSRTRFGQGGLVQALVGYQKLSYDSTRFVMGQTAVGSTEGSQVFAALSVDYMKDMGSLKFGPTGSIEYYRNSIDGFTETGAGIWNQTVGAQSGSTVLGSVGVRGEYQINNDSRLTGAVKYTRISGGDLVIQSGIAGLPSVSFPVSGVQDSLVDLNLGFEREVSSNSSSQFMLRGGYRGVIGSDYESHALQLGLNVSF